MEDVVQQGEEAGVMKNALRVNNDSDSNTRRIYRAKRRKNQETFKQDLSLLSTSHNNNKENISNSSNIRTRHKRSFSEMSCGSNTKLATILSRSHSFKLPRLSMVYARVPVADVNDVDDEVRKQANNISMGSTENSNSNGNASANTNHSKNAFAYLMQSSIDHHRSNNTNNGSNNSQMNTGAQRPQRPQRPLMMKPTANTARFLTVFYNKHLTSNQNTTETGNGSKRMDSDTDTDTDNDMDIHHNINSCASVFDKQDWVMVHEQYQSDSDDQKMNMNMSTRAQPPQRSKIHEYQICCNDNALLILDLSADDCDVCGLYERDIKLYVIDHGLSGYKTKRNHNGIYLYKPSAYWKLIDDNRTQGMKQTLISDMFHRESANRTPNKAVFNRGYR